MPNHTYHFVVISKATFSHEKGAKTSALEQTDLRLEMSNNLQKDQYIDGKGLPRKDSLKPISSALVAGLLANIAQGHEKGWWKDHEHMNWIIDMLQRGFVSSSSVTDGTMEY